VDYNSQKRTLLTLCTFFAKLIKKDGDEKLLTVNSTQARSDWSSVVDSVVRDKPIMIKRTRDRVLLANIELVSDFLEAYKFNATLYTEDDGSTTISSDDLDLVENGKDEKEAKENLAASILDYAEEYYNDYLFWSRGDRKAHKPYVFKALLINDVNEIGDEIICRHGEI